MARDRRRDIPVIGRMGQPDVPVWRQALEGIGLVTLAALAAVAVGALMALVVSWLF